MTLQNRELDSVTLQNRELGSGFGVVGVVGVVGVRFRSSMPTAEGFKYFGPNQYFLIQMAVLTEEKVLEPIDRKADHRQSRI